MRAVPDDNDASIRPGEAVHSPHHHSFSPCQPGSLGIGEGRARTAKPLKPIDTVWPADLKIGLDEITSSGSPFEVGFEEFTVKTAGANK